MTMEFEIKNNAVFHSITGYPIHGEIVTPDDDADLPRPGYVRADAEGAVTVIPYGSTASISLTLVAGEFVPCLVKRVLDSGTDAITLHVFY